MLRTALPLTRRAVLRPSGQRVAARSPNVPSFTRCFAEKPSDTHSKPSIADHTPPVLPGSQAVDIPPPPGSVQPGAPQQAVGVSSNPTEPNAVPLVPPPPISPSSSQVVSPTPKPKRRFRNFLLSFFILSALGFGGGVAYSLRSDNFHDFFTEYIPFGEEAVLYFEEREFRKRFPRLLNPTRARDESPRINIPQKSGMSWRLADDQDETDSSPKGRHMSALNAVVPKITGTTSATSKPAQDKEKAVVPANSKSSQPVKSSTQTENRTEKSATKVETPAAPKGSKATNKMPEVNEPSIYVPISRIDPLKINNADEPVVQDLVKILNDIITVVNGDNSTGKFTSTLEKAKAQLAGVGQKILDLKANANEAAAAQIKKTESEFETAARELIRRLEDEMRLQESKWRGELDSEHQKIAQLYEERLKTEVEKSNEVNKQRLNNELQQQALALKKEFTSNVQSQVEAERDGRLARLSELSTSIDELEKLTTEWNSVIDSNLKTQHLQVAVEAVRSNLEKSDKPRPFIKELAALKEIATDDAVVNSAIASIDPISYQKGIPTSAQLVDRFRRVADEVRKASLLPEDAGIASHAASFVLSKVMFKKQGRAVGDDVESVLTRTETLLEEGNLDDAAREMNTLKGWAKALSSDWLGEVRRVLEVRQALEVISTEARLQSLKVD